MDAQLSQETHFTAGLEARVSHEKCGWLTTWRVFGLGCKPRARVFPNPSPGRALSGPSIFTPLLLCGEEEKSQSWLAGLEPHQPQATGFKASLGHRSAWPCHPGPIGQPTEGSGAQRLRLLVRGWGWGRVGRWAAGGAPPLPLEQREDPKTSGQVELFSRPRLRGAGHRL